MDNYQNVNLNFRRFMLDEAGRVVRHLNHLRANSKVNDKKEVLYIVLDESDDEE
ncbi:hypothetical protein [Veronia pacifica]|uniref:hypothetical protein n=1 Tax=Veronia pacifica TaxID=1080227 RepID=UPI001586341B|nr:hypothetical protein [Veronia pacifica]